MMKFIPAFIALLALTAPTLHALTGEEILRKVDANLHYGTIVYTGTMEIYIGGDKPRVKVMKATGVSDKKAYVEFLNKEDSKTKYLKLDKKMWIHDGEEENTFLISGHLLKEGMMGSDVSYEDALETESLYEKYSISLEGDDTQDGRPCYVIKLEAKVKEVSYEVRKMWIDKERMVYLKEELYAKSGKLLKEMRVLDVQQTGGRWFPVKQEIVNKLRENTKTVFTMTDVRFDGPVDEKIFSIRYLER